MLSPDRRRAVTEIMGRKMTKERVMDRLRPIFERAVRERTGVSYFISIEEMAVFDDADLALLEVQTGYAKMCGRGES